ncbi:Transcriptional regulatory protein OmpR [Boseongicola aestuarii]|uniref:Transcriptional regulatory protein OmpR n=1 Tax=Boseongicola aestuarii TaxID=1470561 RepID=A0A238IVB7_9RHOB|nr:Transcriptional regulatory protein OmpR [Boseongicola aestuarii]
MQHRILIIEDESGVRTLLADVFKAGGYDVCAAATWGEAKVFLQNEKIDLVTLDLKLGPDNGLDIARRIRETSQVAIIMVTGSDDVVDRVVGLELGADDYIVKPFHVREVLARVRAVLRRTGLEQEPRTPHEVKPTETRKSEADEIHFDGLVAVPKRFELFDRSGELCNTTSGDFKLLSIFLDNPKRVLSRDRLMDLIGGTSWSPLDRTIDNQVARLRKKIERNPAEPRIIKTIRGAGYSFTADILPVQSDDSRSKAANLRANSF